MPNDLLVGKILALTADSTPSESVVLRIAAALIKQIDQDYQISEDSDPRIRIPTEEWDWIPDRFEVWNGIPCPKHWAIPERMAAVEREDQELTDLQDQFGGDRTKAVNEYLRRRNISEFNLSERGRHKVLPR